MSGNTYRKRFEDEFHDVNPDPFIGSELIYGLTTMTIHNFTTSKDVALVLFYKPCQSQSKFAGNNLKKAAEITHRTNIGFGTVNCEEEPFACEISGATSTPFFRLYTRGIPVGSIRDSESFPPETMKQFVEQTPILDKEVAAVDRWR